MLELKPLDRNFTSSTTTWQCDPFVGLLPTAVNWSFCNPNNHIRLKGGFTKHFYETVSEFPKISLKSQEEAESQPFSRSFVLMKSGYHEDIDGNGRKSFDEILLFPAIHFGSIFLTIMVLGQYARQVWLNLHSLTLTLSRNHSFGTKRSYLDNIDKAMAELHWH